MVWLNSPQLPPAWLCPCEDNNLESPVGQPADDVNGNDGGHEPRDLTSSHLSTAGSGSACRRSRQAALRPGLVGRHPASLQLGDEHRVEDGDECDRDDEAND